MSNVWLADVALVLACAVLKTDDAMVDKNMSYKYYCYACNFCNYVKMTNSSLYALCYRESTSLEKLLKEAKKDL